MSNISIGIIGAGPAGIAAAIQLSRYGLKPTLFEKSSIGGLLSNANRVENYPGFPDGISGPELVTIFEKHLAKHQRDIRHEAVLNVTHDGSRFTLSTNESTYDFDYILVASGTRANRYTGDVVDSDYAGKVLYEISSIAEIANRHIAIIGAGDAAFDYALNLAKNNRVSIYNRGINIKSLSLLRSRARECDTITYHENAELVGIKRNVDSSISLDIALADGSVNAKVDYLVIAIGREPELGFLSDSVLGNLENLLAGNLIQFIGDVKNECYRQVAIAAGDGVKAAMTVYLKIKEKCE